MSTPVGWTPRSRCRGWALAWRPEPTLYVRFHFPFRDAAGDRYDRDDVVVMLGVTHRDFDLALDAGLVPDAAVDPGHRYSVDEIVVLASVMSQIL